MMVSLILAAGPEPQAVQAPFVIVSIPEGLSAVTVKPRMSGLVWSRALDRYLVVTDDTGRSELKTRGKPMLLAMDAKGVLDPSPIPVSGIERLEDAEAICPGPDDTFFVVTSHSPGSDGQPKKERRQLLHVKLQGRGLKVIGRVDLTNVKGRRSFREIAGFGRKERFEIEALSFHEGMLYIGFRSPLTSAGEAVILRLANPAKSARTGHVSAKGLTRHARLKLCLEHDWKKVCQGLSDMVFLADGSLVMLANVPQGSPPDGGGVLWWARKPVGKSAPILLRHFPALRPEGLALGGDKAEKLVVVFDTGDEPPLWTEQPLPAEPVPPVAAPAAAVPAARR